jgi:hypothetical protein
MKRKLLFILTISAALWVSPSSVQAQNTHQVAVENGNVFVNGKQVSKNLLPTSLHLIDKSTNLKFWSNNDALIEFNNIVYAIENGTLVEASREALATGQFSVYFSSESKELPIKLYKTGAVPVGYVVRTMTGEKPMAHYVEAMNQRAEEFNTLRHKIDSVREPEVAEIALQLKLGAENVARMAESFPQVQLEAYLADMQDMDHSLYDKLMREQQMEMETHHLAMQIREAKSREEQVKIATHLRSALNEIFQFKQENRKTEIEQLTIKLNELQKGLKDRESLRKDIVENRIKELLDHYRW